MRTLRSLLVFVAALVPFLASGAISITAPTSVAAGTAYTVSATCGNAVSVTISKNGSAVAGGGSSASYTSTDNSAGIVGYLVQATFASGPPEFAEAYVTIVAANQTPVPVILVDGQTSPGTITRPFGGSVSVTVRFKATDGNGNLAWIRPNVWHPDDYFYNNGGNGITQTGSAGEVTQTVTLDKDGDWYFWTDAQDAAGAYASTGAWQSGFKLTVNQGPQPNSPPVIQSVTADRTFVYAGESTVLHVRGTDPDGNLRYLNLDLTSPSSAHFGPGSSFNADSPPNNGWCDVGANYGDYTRNVTLQFPSPGTFQFRGAAMDVQSATAYGGALTVTVGRNPTGTIQILDSSRNAFALDGNGRARLALGTQFYVRVNGADGDGNLWMLYCRINRDGGAAFAYEEKPTSGSSNYADFGPYTADTLGVWDVWGHVADATQTGYQWNGGGWYGMHSPDIEVYQPNVAPTISSQPQPLTVNSGQAASFSVTASGIPAPSYQWRKNGSDIAGANGATYSIASASAGDAGTYSVVVTNAAGSVTSSNATLTVNVPPAITSQPVGASVTYGQPVTLAVAATGSPAPSFQWRKNGSAIAGATGASYSIGAATMADAGTYSVVVSNAAGNATSNDATLTVGKATATVTLGSLTQGYDGLAKTATASTNPAGLSVSLTYNGSGTAPVNAGSYTVVATVNDANYQGSATGTLTITQAAPGSVTITSAASSVYGNAYTATATGGASTGALSWSLGTGSTAPGAAIHPSTGAVTANGTGVVVIRAQRLGDVNYPATAWTSDFAITVGQRPLTLTLGGAKPYDGTTTATGATATITAGSLAPGDSLATAFGTTSSANAGSYSVTITPTISNAAAPTSRTGSYAISYNGTFAINPVTITAATIANLVYSGSPQAPSGVSSVTPAGATVTVSAPAQTAAGTYNTATVTGINGYTGTLTNQPWTIDRAPITAATITSLTYNGAAQSPSAVTSVVPAGATVTVSAPAQTAAGTYNTATVTGTGNYQGTLSGVAWTIQKASQAAVTITSGNYTTYGTAFTATATGGTGTGAIIWSLGSGSTAPGAAINASTGAVTTKGSGTVVIRAYRAGDSNYLDSATTADFTITVGKRSITVTLTGSKVYDGTTASTGASASRTSGSLASGDTLSFTYNATSSANVGTYTGLAVPKISNATAPTDRTSSYNITYAGSYAITKATPVITWPAPAAINVGVPLSATQLNATCPTPGSFAYSPAVGTVLSVGSQTLNVTFTPTDATNYATATKSVTLVVNPLPAPTGLTATAPDYRTVNLAWSKPADASGITGYRIFNATTSVQVGQIADVNGLAISFADREEDTTYSYFVRSYGGSNESANSSTVTVTTPLNPLGDKDGDGMRTDWEQANGLDPRNPADALTDKDGDGWTNVAEFKRGSNPQVADWGVAYQGNISSWPAYTADIDQNGLDIVGSTIGSLSVDKGGAAGYSIPLWVVPGTSGMEPKLALNYSSQGGAGFLGQGWSLGGISVISRGPPSKLVDNKIKPVTFTPDDAYYLDGQRLVVVSGTNGAAGSEYRTQIESFTKVIAYGSRGLNGPEYFKAWTKAGLCIEFGNAATARVDGEPGPGDSGNIPGVLSWSVTKITDIAGNYMTFTYDWNVTAREQRLARIDYTGNTNLTPYASVVLNYESGTRPDWRRLYSAGSRTDLISRLASISCYGPGSASPAKVYSFTYDTLTWSQDSILTKITESDGSGRSYRPLVFEYSPPQNSTNCTLEAFPNQFLLPYPLTRDADLPNEGTGFVDLDGDGWTDYVVHRATKSAGAYINVWMGSPDGWQEQTASSPWALPWPLSYDDSPDSGARFADVNGDGRVDFLWAQNGSRGVRLNTGNGWSTPTGGTWTVPVDLANSSKKDTGVMLLDVNGDGLPDLVHTRATSGRGVYLNTGSGWSAINTTTWAVPTQFSSVASAPTDYGARFADINGDGLPDIIQGRLSETGTGAGAGDYLNPCKAWLNNGAGWTVSTFYAPPEALVRDKYPLWGVELVDVNSDGLTDFVLHHVSNTLGTTKRTWLNTGRGWLLDGRAGTVEDPSFVTQWPLAINNASISGSKLRAGAAMIDLNLDGHVDDVWSRIDSSNIWSSGIQWGAGRGLIYTAEWSGLVPGYPLTYDGRRGIGGQFVDVDADGAPDYVWSHESDSNRIVAYEKRGSLRNTSRRPGILSAITNGFGVKVSIEYKPLTFRPASGSGGAAIYDNGTGPISSASRAGIGPMYVVSKVQHDDGAGGTYDLTYTYSGLRSHPVYGNLGFRTTTVTDSRTQTVQVSQYSQTYPFVGMPDYAETRVGGKLVQQSVIAYSSKTYNSGKTILPFATTSIAKTWDLPTVGEPIATSDTTTINSSDSGDGYDAFGNALQIVVVSRDVTNVAAPELARVTTTNTYYDTDVGYTGVANWRLGRLKRTTVKHERLDLPVGQQAITRTSAFTYADNNTGMLLDEIVEPDGTIDLKLTTTRARDAFGNITTVTSTAIDPITSAAVTRTATTVFDAKGRFPASTTNALNHTETYGYDQNFGVRTSLTGPNGLTTTWLYDSFGRARRETRADNTYTETVHNWATENGSPWKYAIETRTKASDGSTLVPPSRTYFDAFGRARHQAALNGDGQLVNVVTHYDNRGLVSSVSQPFFAGAANNYWATTVYDLLGRPTATRAPVDDPAGTSAVLNSLTTITYDGLHTATIVQSPEQGGPYQRTQRKDAWSNALGQNIQIEDNANLDASSPERTVLSKSYDAIGNLASTTVRRQDGAKSITAFVYDLRGRKIGMIEPNMGMWSYAYNAFGELIQQTDAKQHASTLTYDALGRLIKRVQREYVPNERDVTTNWYYDTAPTSIALGTPVYEDKQKGRLHFVIRSSTVASDYYQERYAYDGFGRPASIKRIIWDGLNEEDLDTDSPAGTRAYTFGQSYDAYGRLDRTTYPNGFQVRQTYSALGLVQEVRRSDGSHSEIYWQAAKDGYNRTVDEYGRPLAARLGNGIDLAWARPTAGGGVRRITATFGLQLVRQFDYAYDGFANVRSRADQWADLAGNTQSQSETFAYDSLQRLTTWQVGTDAAKGATYDSLGNLATKSDVGSYTYDAGKLHQLTSAGGRSFSYDANGNCIADGQRTIQWTAFNQVYRIDKGGQFAEFYFDSSHQRVRQINNSGTTIYAGGLVERFIPSGASGSEYRYYVMTPTGRTVMHTSDGSSVDGRDQYFVGDALGSIASIYDNFGRHVETRRYDPWGVQTKVIAGSPSTGIGSPSTRGFTDHEMLENLGFIHMNGRVYDPVLGRFLSADPNVDGVETALGYNRYSYVHNNPLGSTDPSGYFSLGDALKIVAVVVVAIVATVVTYGLLTGQWVGVAQIASVASGSTAVGGSFSGLWQACAIVSGMSGGFAAGFTQSLLNGGSIGDAFRSGVIGALTSLATTGIAGINFNGTSQLAWKVAAHGVVGGVVSELQGGEFRHGFYSSAAAAGMDYSALGSKLPGKDTATGRTIRAAVVGGTASEIGGGKFANGAVTSAFQHRFNFESMISGWLAETFAKWFSDWQYTMGNSVCVPQNPQFSRPPEDPDSPEIRDRKVAETQRFIVDAGAGVLNQGVALRFRPRWSGAHENVAGIIDFRIGMEPADGFWASAGAGGQSRYGAFRYSGSFQKRWGRDPSFSPRIGLDFGVGSYDIDPFRASQAVWFNIGAGRLAPVQVGWYSRPIFPTLPVHGTPMVTDF